MMKGKTLACNKICQASEGTSFLDGCARVRSALEALYSSRVDLDRGRRGAMISSFSSA